MLTIACHTKANDAKNNSLQALKAIPHLLLVSTCWMVVNP
jgi:hypothetical protein